MGKKYLIDEKDIKLIADAFKELNDDTNAEILEFEFGKVLSVINDNELRSEIHFYANGIDVQDEINKETPPEYEDDTRRFLCAINVKKLLTYLANKPMIYEVGVLAKDEKFIAIKRITVNHKERKVVLSE